MFPGSENPDLGHPAVGAILITADNVFDSVAGPMGKENWASDLDK